MRILIAAGNLEKTSGFNVIARQIAIELKKRGHEILVFCIKKPLKFEEHENDNHFLELFDEKTILDVKKKISKFKPDIIFSHGVIILTDLIAIRYALKSNLPVVNTVHTRFHKYIETITPDAFRHVSRKLGFIIEKAALVVLQKADMVIIPSSEMQDYLNKAGIDKTAIISNGVYLHHFQPSEKDAPDKQKTKYLVNVGQIQKRKNQTFLLDMAEFLEKNIKLKLIGGSERAADYSYFLEFKNKLKKNKKKNVEYLGRISRKEVCKNLESSHLYVTTSYMEAQSVSQIEAIVMGLPTVRFYDEYTSGMTVHNKTAIHLDNNTTPKEFAETVNQLLNNEKKYNEMRKNCLEERNIYDWINIAEKTEHLFIKVIDNKNVQKHKQ